MRRIDDDPRDRRTVTLADPDLIADDDERLTIDLRKPPVINDAAMAMIDAVVSRFADAVVPGGCIRRGKVRPDTAYVRLFLLREATRHRVTWTKLARMMGYRPRYARFAWGRGRDLIAKARADGRLDDLQDLDEDDDR